MAIVVTPEIRRAVCLEMGHVIQMDRLFTGGLSMQVKGRDDKLPHIYCGRCNQVWLVIEQPGDDYAAAEKQLADRLVADDPLKVQVATAEIAATAAPVDVKPA